jgi:hypothetical protein
MDNFTEIWGIGPEQSTTNARNALMRSVGFILAIAGMVYVWDPASHRQWVLIFN